jgi:hypothetical protein
MTWDNLTFCPTGAEVSSLGGKADMTWDNLTSCPTGAEVSSLGGEADHSPPSGEQVKNAYSYLSSACIFKSWCLIKHIGKFFSFTFLFAVRIKRTKQMKSANKTPC